MKRVFDKKQKKRNLTRLQRIEIIIGIIVGVIIILSYVSSTNTPIELYNYFVSIIQEPEPRNPSLKLIDNPIVIIESQEVLGGSSNRIWLEAHDGNYQLPPEFTFDICSFDGKIRVGSGSVYKKNDNDLQSIEIQADVTLPENATRKLEWDFAKVIGICGDWNPFPRKPYVTDGGSVARDAYIMEIASHFEDTKLKNCTILIDEIIRVDLEGDSKVDKKPNEWEEAIIIAHGESDAGGFTIVLFRKYIRKDKVVINDYVIENIKILDESVDQEPLKHSRVPFILDANGDGKLEVFVETHSSTGAELIVFELSENHLEEVLRKSFHPNYK